MTSITIRPYSLDDLDPMIELGRVYHEESPYARVTIDEQRLRALHTMAETSPTDWCSFIAEDGEYILGLIVGTITPAFFCDQKQAGDLVLYVHPSYRGSTIAMRLILAYENWALTNGAQEIFLSQSAGMNINNTAKFYEAMGFEQVGTIHKKGV